MRVGSLIVAFTLGSLVAVLAGTVVLDRCLSWLLEENELPVELERLPPPNFVSKYIIWLQQAVRPPSALECKVYLATSTIPSAGMGLYTAVDLHENDQVGASEIVIPITFPRHKWALWKVWFNYVWTSDIPNIDVDATSAAFVPGIGSSLNSHYWELTNLYVVGKAQYDTAQLHRTHDVGSGAFTPYHKASTNAFRSVPAGSELFSYYGDSFFRSNLQLDAQSFQMADNVMADYKAFLRKHPELSDDMKGAIWAELIQDFPVSITSEGFMAFASLPQRSWADLENEESRGVSLKSKRRTHKHSREWLQDNGFCMDWIEAGQSTLPQAGRGAFATRFIPKGTVIALAPLIHIFDPDKEIVDWSHDLVKKELVRNYSFGNRQTSVLLTPHGAGVGLINHASKESNVDIRWPSQELPCHNPLFLTLPVSALAGETTIRLSLEYVAKRNVYPGEELFLNYGAEWEAAWDRHVQQWRPQTQWFVHPSQVNRNEPIRTVTELGFDPYPPNLYLTCQASYSVNEDGINVHIYAADEAEWLPCQVLSRIEYSYEVELETGVVMEEVPHNAIMFDTLPGMSDWALPKAFRHEILLPDGLIPDVWKDKHRQPCE
jgi:hypothetical protein